MELEGKQESGKAKKKNFIASKLHCYHRRGSSEKTAEEATWEKSQSNPHANMPGRSGRLEDAAFFSLLNSMKRLMSDRSNQKRRLQGYDGLPSSLGHGGVMRSSLYDGSSSPD